MIPPLYKVRARRHRHQEARSRGMCRGTWGAEDPQLHRRHCPPGGRSPSTGRTAHCGHPPCRASSWATAAGLWLGALVRTCVRGQQGVSMGDNVHPGGVHTEPALPVSLGTQDPSASSASGCARTRSNGDAECRNGAGRGAWSQTWRSLSNLRGAGRGQGVVGSHAFSLVTES